MRNVGLILLATALSACGQSNTPPILPPIGLENSDLLCSDRQDNDGDTLIDCADPDCASFCTASVENCNDRVDNDGDNLVDCADDDCGALHGCGEENTNGFCNDNRDNDGDGHIDCDDEGCQTSAEVDYCGGENTNDLCRDNLDNDRDTLTDCDDPDCTTTTPCMATETEDDIFRCTDAIDNDDDTLIDCQDPDCQNAGVAGCAPTESGSCDDWFDNDGDGRTDCDDSDCDSTPACDAQTPEDTVTLCSNGLDDDLDSYIDCADFDCLNSVTVDFCGREEGDRCSDEIDNDGDRLVDCDDPGCNADPFCVPVDLEDDRNECTDLVDNDGDQLVDCADDGCAGRPVCGPEDTAATCSDDFDNDGDGISDCDDDSCAATLPCAGTPEQDAPTCADGIDNDGDSLADCADPGCADVVMDPACAAIEDSDALCDDSFDNDGDGDSDCADPDCNAAAPCVLNQEVDCGSGANACCSNQSDDDLDEYADCADFDCLLSFADVSACDQGLSIHDLQDATDNDIFDLALRGDDVKDPVRLRDVVILFIDPTDDQKLWVADPGAPTSYSALRVFIPYTATNPDGATPDTLAVGDVVDLAGLATEFLGETEVLAYAWQDTGTDAALPSALMPSLAELDDDLPAGERANDWYLESTSTGEITDPYDDLLTAERFESMLVTLSSLVITDINLDDDLKVETYSVAAATDLTGPTFLVGIKYATPADALAVGQPINSVTGIVRYYRRQAGAGFIQEYRLQPRNASDWNYSIFFDSDNDGLSDSDEALFGTDELDPDTDHDYFLDSEEILNPTDANDPINDTDDDGVIDALESYLLDLDGDGWPNELDSAHFDGPGDDRDGDGVTNDNDEDDDNDYVCDPGVPEGTNGCWYVNGQPDNCPFAPDTSAGPWPDPFTQTDPILMQRNIDAAYGTPPPIIPTVADLGDIYDSSGSGDVCDWDSDGDFWPTPFDNCPGSWNPSQADADEDGVGDACPTDALPGTPLACTSGLDGSYQGDNGGYLNCSIIIEEVLYNLSSAAPAGIVDANRDGIGDVQDDELIEIRNVTDVSLDLSGLSIEDEANLVRHVFPNGTVLRSNQRLVVFGGGSPQLFPSWVVVQTASSGTLGLNNGGDTVFITSGDTPLVELTFGRTDTPTADWNTSVTRYPDGTDHWMPHPLRRDPAADRLWNVSPGDAPDNDRP